MAEIFDRIRSAVIEGRYMVGDHADNALLERAIASWQLEAGIMEAKLLRERPSRIPWLRSNKYWRMVLR
jgi:hypothetical protein